MLSTALLPGAEAWSAPGTGWPCDRPPGPTLGAGSLTSFAGGGCCPRAVTRVAGGRWGGVYWERILEAWAWFPPSSGCSRPQPRVRPMRSPVCQRIAGQGRQPAPAASASPWRFSAPLPPSPCRARLAPCPTHVRAQRHDPASGRPRCRAARLVPDPSRSSPAPLKHPTPAVRRRSAGDSASCFTEDGHGPDPTPPRPASAPCTLLDTPAGLPIKPTSRFATCSHLLGTRGQLSSRVPPPASATLFLPATPLSSALEETPSFSPHWSCQLPPCPSPLLWCTLLERTDSWSLIHCPLSSNLPQLGSRHLLQTRQGF